MLLELFNLHALSQLRVEDTILLQDFVAFIPDLNHGRNDLGLNEQRVEAESGELLWEVVRWDRHQAEIRHFFGLWLRRQLQVCWDQLCCVVFEHATAVVVVLLKELALLIIIDRLLHDDLVHRSSEVTDHLRQDSSLVNLGAALQGLCSHGHFLDSSALFSIGFRELLKRHEVDEEVVPDLRVGVYTL